MKRTTVFILVAAVLFVFPASGCSGLPSPSPTPTLPPPTLTTSLKPIEIVSALGPLEPITPAGPEVEITIKNVSNEPVILLEVTLDAGAVSPQNPYVFSFDVSPARPLNPGQSISARRVLIGAGFGDTPLPLTISGRLEGNVLFFYVTSVVITPPQ